ncbi:MAG: hypothetical protein WBV83_19580 [Bradyrhizobium sp.]|uniref:hypothetical protein n=1 Tax=Bradyrhizobium sp. TaxID=376 RepID=UPI003C5287F6
MSIFITARRLSSLVRGTPWAALAPGYDLVGGRMRLQRADCLTYPGRGGETWHTPRPLCGLRDVGALHLFRIGKAALAVASMFGLKQRISFGLEALDRHVQEGDRQWIVRRRKEALKVNDLAIYNFAHVHNRARSGIEKIRMI